MLKWSAIIWWPNFNEQANIIQTPGGEQDAIYSQRLDENDMIFHDSAPPMSIEYLMESILNDEKVP